jgi:hypothetical protein
MGLTNSFSRGKAYMHSPPGRGWAGSTKCDACHHGVRNWKDEEICCLKASPFRRIFFIHILGAPVLMNWSFEKNKKQKKAKL